jgi:acyl-coenzyme A synthetase/AMP-(fatty) acid ligase
MEKKDNFYFPTKKIKEKAWLKDKNIYQKALKNPLLFWENLAKELFWRKSWKKVFEHKPPYFKWFLEGKINITENIFEKNKLGWPKIKNKLALIWEPEPKNERERKLTYKELFEEVCKFANALKKLGVKKGDRVGIYLPMIPEVIISMLACARIGAVHSVVFSAFSPQALRVRLQDTQAKILITADGYYRRGKLINLKEAADEGIKETKVEKIIVVKRAKNEIFFKKGRDFWWHNLIEKEKDYSKAATMDSEDLLFVLYTSGSTGKPKGCVHTCGGYTVQAYWTGKWIFDLHDEDIMWCVPGNTKVITNFAFKEISKIKPGDLVLSHKGNFVKVLNVFKRYYKGELIKINTYYSNEPILITPNHKILVSKDRVGPFKWTSASELKKGDHVLFPIPRGKSGNKRILQISDFLNSKDCKFLKVKERKIFSSKGTHKIPNQIKIDENFMRLCGYYVAEGSVDKDSIYFNFGKHEKSYIEDVKNLLREIMGIEAKVKRSHRWTAPVYVTSKILLNLFKKQFGAKAEQKRLPSWFISLPKRLLAEFIKGFWRGDGYSFNTGFEFNTISRTLAIQLKIILLKLGIIPSVRLRKVNKKKIRYIQGRKITYKHNIYRISISGISLNKISEILEINHPFLFQRSKTYHRGKITGKFLWTKVTSVSREKYEGPVYNLKTDSKTYTLSSFCVHNCTADVGWITSHTYGCYSPLLNGTTFLIYEGAPDYPTPDRWAKIIEKYKVTIFYTAPTAIRMFVKYGKNWLKNRNLSSLRILGSVGEPIDEETWQWYFKEVGKGKCPILDTWWQTETGGILITSLPGIGPFKPAFVGLPFPGLKFDILDEKGKSLPAGKEGNLVILPPFAPGLLRGIYKNPQKYKETYWSEYGPKIYFTSDAAFKDKNGLIRIVGRVDDVIKVAGHRLTTGELENAINKLEEVTESAVVGIPDEIKGEVPVAFVVAKKIKKDLPQKVISQVRKEIGPIASLKEVYLVKDLPKTRSGKIMRRILKKLFTGEELGDLSTLANPESVEEIKLKYKMTKQI